jgi:hypothetical protein
MIQSGAPGAVAGEAKAITQCTTHNWTFEGQPFLTCPIGRIEDAAEEAIRKIRAEHETLKRERLSW